MAKPRILSVSYNQALLFTRQYILEQAGYQVTSALGMAIGLEHCAAGVFDLIVIGHSIPAKDKEMLIAAAKARCPAPVLSLQRYADRPHPYADFSVDAAEGPEVFLQAVRHALGGAAEHIGPTPPSAIQIQPESGKEQRNV